MREPQNYPLYVEAAFGRLLIEGYRYPRSAPVSRMWDTLREAGWIADRIRFDAQTGAWIARAFVRSSIAS